MTTENINLPDGLRKILRSHLSMDLKTTSDVAKIIGISRSTLTFALDGKRSLSKECLEKLYDHFGLVEFLPNPEVAHYLKVGADIEPLVNIFSVFYQSELSYIKPFGNFDLDESFIGFFVFECINGALFLVHRDKKRSGKGVVSKTEIALPIKPEAFKNNKVTWAKNREIVLYDDMLRKLEAPFYKKSEPPSLDELRRILDIPAKRRESKNIATWLDVRRTAEDAKLTADEVIKMIIERGR